MHLYLEGYIDEEIQVTQDVLDRLEKIYGGDDTATDTQGAQNS